VLAPESSMKPIIYNQPPPQTQQATMGYIKQEIKIARKLWVPIKVLSAKAAEAILTECHADRNSKMKRFFLYLVSPYIKKLKVPKNPPFAPL
jgi:hypothetical protein